MPKPTSSFREISLHCEGLCSKGQFPDNRVVSSKYTLITFVPKNLLEQFRRMVNFFFLVLIILQVSIDIPVNPIPYIAAFVFVIGLTAIKQGYEDFLRHRADNKVNFALVDSVDDNGAVKKIKSKDVRVGSLLKLQENEAVPCDLLLVACESQSGSQSFCQITTANLDGESSLKMRFIPVGLESILQNGRVSGDLLKKYRMEYDLPNSDLYSFNGHITSQDLPKPLYLSMENILFRGSTVKNCQAVYGVAIYTGPDTRLSRNSNKVKMGKFSTVEGSMNRIVLGMFVTLVVLSGLSTGLSFLLKRNTFDDAWYIPTNDDSDATYGVMIFFSYMVLLCYMIPISLSVTFELQKLVCSRFFAWDEEMICPITGAMPLCNTSDLNEELGQVEILFTDKTGTLTDNDLVFKCSSINGKRLEYVASEESRLIEFGGTDPESAKPIVFEEYCLFVKAIAVCHTVRVYNPTTNNNYEDLVYQASSLDEEVLLRTAASLGIHYLGGEENQFKLRYNGSMLSMQMIAVLEFDSDRKCMSVIVQDEEGEYVLFSKGAESTLLPQCTGNNSDLVETTLNHVTDFAKMGYRTMVVAYKQLKKEIVQEFVSKLDDLRGSPEELKELYRRMESDLTLLGCTGMEDKLQEGVPETIGVLKEAGIKIVMITGDKLETAVSIASTCGILPTTGAYEDMVKVGGNLTVQEVEELLQKSQDKYNCKESFVIDGQNFATAFENCKQQLQNAILNAESVILCRMAPLQKSQVVHLVKSVKQNPLKTCAVGDGGNDCAMLREAHLGIGIIGKEGLQAARESDFAIPRFRFLQKALLVHGHWFYHRLAGLITYFFYRGLVMIFQIVLFGIDSGFSANTIFHSTFVMMFTIAFTSIPVLIQGVTDQPYPKERLLRDPRLYGKIRKNALMSFRNMFQWFVVGVWHTLICYYVPKYVWMESSRIDDYGAFSLLISFVLVVIIDTKNIVETRHFNWLSLSTQIFSYVAFIGFYLLISHAVSDGTGPLAFSFIPLLQQVNLWFAIILVAVLSIIPDLMFSAASVLVGRE